MGRIWSWIVAFGRFWYHFIVGDDWTVAVAVAVGLILTWILNSSHITAWWLVPLIVVTMLGLSLRRAKPKT
jgi:Na+/phosphate symporter